MKKDQSMKVSPRKQMAMGKKISPVGPTAKGPVKGKSKYSK